MSLQDFELSGALSAEPLTSGEVARYRQAINERLTDANREENSNRNRLEQAYYTILNCALIALRVDGYRVNTVRGHHQITLETLIETMGIDNTNIDYFIELSQARGSDLYDAMPISDSDVSDAIRAATDLTGKLNAWLEVRAPDS